MKSPYNGRDNVLTRNLPLLRKTSSTETGYILLSRWPKGSHDSPPLPQSSQAFSKDISHPPQPGVKPLLLRIILTYLPSNKRFWLKRFAFENFRKFQRQPCKGMKYNRDVGRAGWSWAELSCSWKTSLSSTRFLQGFWNQKGPSEMSQMRQGNWSFLPLYDLLWMQLPLGGSIKLGQSSSVWQRVLPRKGFQLWVVSSQHSSQLGMLGISGASGSLTTAPHYSSHLCALSHLLK